MLNNLDDVRLMKWNAEIIVKFTTAYPFRLPYDTVICLYCAEQFKDFALFRRHMDEFHQSYNRRVVFHHVSSENFLKLDCTELTCRICSNRFQTLAEIAKHLRAEHKARLRLEKQLDILPYILAKDRIACGICGSNQPGIRHLGRHIANHFQRFTCESCGKSYINNTGLKVHVRSCTKKGIYPCLKCHKEFLSTEERREHVVSSKRCWHYVCEVCKTRFVSWRQKQEHLVEVHGRPKRTHTCPECGEVFEKGDWFRKHFRTIHSHKMLKCLYCDKLWENKHSLERHLVTHTKEKPYPCEYCSKAFGTKTLLTQHSWMHKEDKRFECTICDKKFNQRVSWKGHMKTRHPEFGIV